MALILFTGCTKRSEMELTKIIDTLREEVAPLSAQANESYWKGAITGDAGYFDQYAETVKKINLIYSDKATFEKLKKYKEGEKIKNPLLKRQLDIIYLSFLQGQADTTLQNTIIEKESAIEQKYANFRATYKGKEINDNTVEEILRTSTNNSDLEEVWKGHKAIGNVVAADVVELVKLRNTLAQSLGFDNFHSMSLSLSDQNPQEISDLFDELDVMTAEGFAALKREMDEAFSKRYHLPAEKLMPWHFQGRFFQEAPILYPVDLDKYYKGKNLGDLTADFYASIGLDVTAILNNSDLYPKEGKNQHAFCTDIDRKGDVRILCNITDNEAWMSTMLHEFGHGVYALGHDYAGNPYFLRDAAHTFTTEGVAMLFERMSRNPEWMKKMLNVSEEEAALIADDCYKSLRLQQLVFSRWTQVVYRFEKEMYSNPDQDLNKLWWDMVSKYQLLNIPEGRGNEADWASKIHIALYPCYYHNYQLGALFASQMHYYIINNITKSGDVKGEYYIGKREVGEWMQEYIFNPGQCLPWNDMIEKATGEKLTAKYFKMQFVEEW